MCCACGRAAVGRWIPTTATWERPRGTWRRISARCTAGAPRGLERHGQCPFYAFLSNVLELVPREVPSAGLDVRQLGTIYHRILERLYATAADPASMDSLLVSLPAVAGEVLDAAPRREGFRTNAWWQQTRAGIAADLLRSVVALEESSRAEGWVIERPPERAFLRPPLVVPGGDDSFRVRGVIDRVDQAADGRRRVD